MTAAEVTTMYGLGDCVYARPAVRHLLSLYDTVYVRTPWPQLFFDLDRVRFASANPTTLRAQRDNMNRPFQYEQPPRGLPAFRLTYDSNRTVPLPRQLLECVGGSGLYDFTLPGRSPSPKPIMLAHPPTVRREWSAPARCCDPAAIQAIIDLFGKDFEVIERKPMDHEVLFGPPLLGTTPVETPLFEELLAMVSVVSLLVTSVGFMLPLGIALRVPTVCVFGGHLPPERLVEDCMNLRRYRSVVPINPQWGDINGNPNRQCRELDLVNAVEEVLRAA